MQQVLLSFPDFQWIDVIAPSAKELQGVAEQFNLRKDFISDSMDSRHLPKYEKRDDAHFIIVRHFDLEAKRRADSTTKLTRKIAMVVTPKLLLTIHRKSQPFFQQTAARFTDPSSNPDVSSSEVATYLIDLAMQTFEAQIEVMENELSEMEDGIFGKPSYSKQLTETHRIIQRLSVFKRILIHSAAIFQKWSVANLAKPHLLKDLREFNDHMIFFADELLEDGRSLLQLHLSLASHRTGEIMRVLTVFSVFFMPLTFIVGIYGMNFKFMPELEWPLGYLSVWVLMAVVTLAIAAWFFRRGWLASGDRTTK